MHTIHSDQAQVQPVGAGIPWLGFVVFPDHRRVRGSKVRFAGRRLGRRFEDGRAGRISFAEFDAGVQGWINHVRHASTWRLREKMLAPFVWGPEDLIHEWRATHGTADADRKVRFGRSTRLGGMGLLNHISD